MYVVARISSSSCLTVLPGPAWILLSKTYKPLFAPLYLKLNTDSATEKMSYRLQFYLDEYSPSRVGECCKRPPNTICHAIYRTRASHGRTRITDGEMKHVLLCLHFCYKHSTFKMRHLSYNFGFQICLQKVCLSSVEMTLDAPKINTTFEGKFGTQNYAKEVSF